MKIFSLLTAILLIVLNLSFANASETIKIASIFGSTGIGDFENRPTIKGIQFAVQELNDSGGLLGKKIELLELDNLSTALGSKIAAKKAVTAGVKAVFGANWSSNSLAMAPIFQAAKIPMISPFSTHSAVTLVGDYIFRVCFINSFQGTVMANFAFNNMKARTAGVLINANSRYSETLSTIFKQNFTELGGQILFEKSYLQDSENFMPCINKIKLLHPDVVFLPGYIIDSARIIKQARDNGITTPILGGDGWANTMYKIAGSSLHGNFYTAHWHPDSKKTESLLFLNKYETKNGKLNGIGQALAYDTVSLYADAVKRAGTFQPSRVREALAATKNFKGVSGDITFNKNGDPIKSAVVVKFDMGTTIYVKTIDP
ncbi:ABC transporter substrate-binding protein [bacterium]|nr:ABC transporter substrate-binding protein [bacterium]